MPNSAATGRERHDAGVRNRDGSRNTGGNRGKGSADQRHANRLSEINRVARATGTSSTPVGNTGVSTAGRVSSALQGMARDYRNVGNTPIENFGNRVASFLGFNEQRPSMQAALGRVQGTPAGQVTDRRAGWGFDPAGLIGGALGSAFGVPFTGMAADWVSQQFGRPLEISMGPQVFGGGYTGGPLSPQGTQYGGTGMSWGGVLAPQTAQGPIQQQRPAAPSIPQSQFPTNPTFKPAIPWGGSQPSRQTWGW